MWIYKSHFTRDIAGESHAGEARPACPALIVARKIESDHLIPVLPVVRPAIPETQGVANAFAPEQARHLLVAFAKAVVLADGQDDVLCPQRCEASFIVFMADEHRWIVEIEIVVGIAISEAADIAQPRQAEDAVDESRVPQAKTQGMEAAKAAAQGNEERIGVLVLTERQHLFEYIVVVLRMKTEAGSRVFVIGIPALCIYRIDTVDLHPATVDAICHHIDHAAIGELKVAAL